MRWFCFFVMYSFLGFLLERAFAAIRHNPAERKFLLVFPLCPVYGLGVCAALALAPLAEGRPLALFLAGCAACTGAEYAAAAWYERCLGVSFWDYSGLTGNIRGRVCPLFSLAWGVLFLAGYRWIHPAVARLAAWLPAPAAAVLLAAVAGDLILSGLLLRYTGDTASLCRPAAFLPGRNRSAQKL